MIFDLITIGLVGLVLAFAGFTVLQFMGKFPTRTRDDVSPFLRPSDVEELETLLDRTQEANLRFELSPTEYRTWQRKRVHLMREYLLRMSHNALVLIEWGNMELAQVGFPDPDANATATPTLSQRDLERQALAQELIQAATEFRLYSVAARLKLKAWILFRLDQWPSFAEPSVSRLRTVVGIDAITSYHRLKTAAGSLSMAYGYDYHQQVVNKL
jgi:hypothetical protein